MGFQDEYQREWKRRDPENMKRETTPAPKIASELEEAMRYYLTQRDLDYDVAKSLGNWYPAWYHGPRIIIPCLRSDGGQFWQGRLIEQAAVHTLDFGQTRWDSAHGYRGDAVCYIPADPANPTVVVEGPMDALAAASCGFPAIAVLGSMPPQLVFDQVVRLVETSYRKGSCFIVPDADRLGDWINTQAQLGARGVYGSIQQLPGGFKDLAEMPQPERQEFLDGL